MSPAVHTHTPMHTCAPHRAHIYTPIMHTYTYLAHIRPHHAHPYPPCTCTPSLCTQTCRAHTPIMYTHTCPYSAHPHLPCTCTIPFCTPTSALHTQAPIVHRQAPIMHTHTRCAHAHFHHAHTRLLCTRTPAVRLHAPSSISVCRLHWVSPEFLKCQHRECLCRVGTLRETGRAWSTGRNQDPEGIS